MTSANWASRFVDEREVKGKEASPTTDRQLKSEEMKSFLKTVAQTYIWFANTRCELSNLQKFCLSNHHHVVVLLFMLRSQAQLS